MSQFQNVKVVAIVGEFGMWNMELLQGWLPTYIINKIAALPPPSNIEDANVRICMDNTISKIVIAYIYNDLCGFNEDGNYDLDWRKI
jgi:hypothetical protein